MRFTYTTDELQIGWSEDRQALGEYIKPGNHPTWSFMGWLFEGQVGTWDRAVEMTGVYLRMFANGGRGVDR